MESADELSCVYSALILLDDDVAITGEKIHTILKAAKVDVEPYWPGLFAKSLDGVNIKAMITNVGAGIGSGGGGAPAGAPAAAAQVAEKKEEKKEEKKKEEEPPESDEDMGFGLFD